jgi:hypothetical protein
MADKKISALTGATTPLAGTEVLPIVQGGSTVKVSIANVTAGRAVSTGALSVGTADITLDNAYALKGKLVAGSAVAMIKRNSADEVAIDEDGYGAKIGFGGRFGFAGGGNLTVGVGNLVIGTAGKGIDFSANGGDVLTQYDEGTWTPNQGSGLVVVGAFSSNGRYTRVGRLVTVSGTVIGATSIAVSAIGQICDNLPFTKAGASVSTGTALSSSLTTSGVAAAGGAILYSLVALSGGTQILFALTYEVA